MEAHDSGEFGPTQWTEPIHGSLLILNKDHARETYRRHERGSGMPGEPLVEGVLNSWVQRDSPALVLHTPDGWTCTSMTSGADGSILVVTHLDGGGGEEILADARKLPESIFADTGERFDVGSDGLVLFDCTATWDIVRDGMHVAIDAPPGSYAVTVAALAGKKPRRMRVIRLVPR